MAAQLPESHLANLFIEFYSDNPLTYTLGKHRNKSRPFGRLFLCLGADMERPNYRQRERIRARLKAMGEPCAICGKPIDYELDWWIDPKDGKRKRHPLSFEYDHITPYSVACDDYDVNSFGNAQAVHRICNQRKSGRNRLKNFTAYTQLEKKCNGVTPAHMEQGNEIPTSRAW